MTRSFVDKDEAVEALRAIVPDVTNAIRNMGNQAAPAIGEWTAGDVAAHLIDVAEDAQDIAQGKGTRFEDSSGVAANNAARLAARTDRDPRSLAEQYQKAMSDYLGILEGIDGDPGIPWGDFKIPLSALVSTDIGESLIHGYDIAHAEAQPWNIDPYKAALAGRGISPMTEHYVDPQAAAGFTGTFDLRMRGYSALHFVFENGTLTIQEPADRKVDVHISADPVAFMLVGYGRISQWGPMSKGKLLAWGRKPWLAMKLAKMLRNP